MSLNIKGNIISSNDISSLGIFETKVNRDGLVLYLDAGNLDSYPTTGTTWTDLSGTGNNATLVSGATYNSSSGGTIDFDGSNDYVTAGNSGMTHRTNDFSYCLWKNVTTTDIIYNRTLFSNAVYTNGLLIRPYTNSVIEIYAQNVNYGSFTYVATQNAWKYLCFVRYGSQLYFFVNGVYSQVMTFTPDIQPNSSTLYIGASGHAVSQCFLGKIGSVHVYDRALNPYEIAENFQSTKGRYSL